MPANLINHEVGSNPNHMALANTMAQRTLGLEYSAFFSSGLLAPRTPQKKVNSSSSWDDNADVNFVHSPARPSSPMSIPDESLMDIDMASCNLGDDRRSTTPTPQTITPTQSPQPVKIQSKSHAQAQPRLRKRRSSLTQATSLMNAIRSPARTASNALHLQRQLYAIGPVSPRSRSGSVGEDIAPSRYGVASSETSLEGRLRSGSLGAPPGAVRRRPIRRLHISALQAPVAPPPTIPLPALPSIRLDQQHFRPMNLNSPPFSSLTRTTSTKVSSFSTSSASTTFARARGLSVSNSALDGEANRIDEDMKEN